MNQLAQQMAYVTINPRGAFLRSLEAGFAEVGFFPAYLICVRPWKRVLAEWRKHRLSVFKRTFLPKLRANRKASDRNVTSRPLPQILKVKDLNTDVTVRLLERLKIRYLINAGAGIFRSGILSIPHLMVVN